jgi:hypothetical protein
MRITKKKIVGVVAATAVVALGSTAAFAYWSASGDATGQASVGSASPISVAFDFGTQQLVPAGTITVTSATATNPNAYAISIDKLDSISLGGFATGCSAADFSVLVDGTPSTSIPFPVSLTPVSVAPGTNSFALAGHTVAIHMDNTAANQDACQGNTLTLTAHFGA